MLVPEMDPIELEGVKQIAEAMASALTDEQRDQMNKAAWPLVEHLTDMCGSQVTASRVASLIADLMSALGVMNIYDLAARIEGSVAAYSLAAAHLAGVRDLPEKTLGFPELGFNLN